jgi:hypothetical protein
MCFNRKAITIYDEDSTSTFMKPFSEEYSNQLLIIHEDAYGKAVLVMESIEDIKKKFSGDSEEFDEMLRQL